MQLLLNSYKMVRDCRNQKSQSIDEGDSLFFSERYAV